jgi:hypothetical protein
LAALDAATGDATGWNPSPNGTFDNYAPFTWSLNFGPDGSLWAGGTFLGVDGVPQAGIARFAPTP